MNFWRRFRVAGLCVWAATAALQAQDQPDSTALTDLVTTCERAVRSGNIPHSGVRTRLAEDFSAVLPTGQTIASYGELSRAENTLRVFIGRGAVYETVDVRPDPFPFISGDLAVLTGSTRNHATAQGSKERRFTTHWTAAARRVDGEWKLLRHNAVMEAGQNPWHIASVSGPSWGWLGATGLICGTLGLALGVVLAKKCRRPSTVPPPGASSKNAKSRAWEAAPSPTTLIESEKTSPASPPTRSWESTTSETPTTPPPSSSRSKRSWES